MPEYNRRGEPIVVLYTLSKPLAKKVEEHFKAEGVELVIIDEPKDMPARGRAKGEFVLSTRALSVELERFAARCGGMVAVWPESADFVLKKCQDGQVNTMFGHELMDKMNL